MPNEFFVPYIVISGKLFCCTRDILHVVSDFAYIEIVAEAYPTWITVIDEFEYADNRILKTPEMSVMEIILLFCEEIFAPASGTLDSLSYTLPVNEKVCAKDILSVKNMSKYTIMRI